MITFCYDALIVVVFSSSLFRKHCQYYGGYHDKHKIVVWLWEILKNDFNAEEKSEFLKVN